MPELGSSKFTLRVAGDKFKQGLASAKTQADKTSKGISAGFSKAQKSIQGAAGKVPVIGGALAGLTTPSGAAAAGIALVVGGLVKMVSKTLDVGRRLGELREKLGVSAEGIQIYERAIEEGNGNTAAFEKTTLRLQKTIGDAAGGNKAAAAQFDALGLSFEDLANKSPEEALRAVLGAANDTLGPTDRASVLAATLGRSYADLGGFATKGADELTAMLDGVKDVAVTMSGEGVTAVDQYDTANRNMRDSFGSIVTEVGMALIPTITQLFGVIKQLMPIIKVVIAVALVPLQLAVTRVSAAIDIISALLRGDFTGALNYAKNFFIDTATILLDVGAKVVGLFNKDMADSIRGVSADLKAMKVVAEEDAVPALDATSTAIESLGDESDTATPKVAGLGAAASIAADDLSDYEKALNAARDAVINEREEAEIAIRVQNDLAASFGALEEYSDTLALSVDELAEAQREMAEATETARDWVGEYQIRLLGARKETDMFALSLGRLRTGYSNIATAADKAAAAIARASGGDAEITQRHPDGSGQSGRPAPPPRNATGGAITQVWPAPSGNHAFQTANSGGRAYSLNDWPSRRAEAEAWLAANGTGVPAAQHGAFVRGSRMGSLVRVGENFTDENITPLRGANGGGSSGGQKMVIPVNLGGETLATIYIDGKRVAVREGRD